MLSGTAHEVACCGRRIASERSGVFFCLAATQTETAAELMSRAAVL